MLLTHQGRDAGHGSKLWRHCTRYANGTEISIDLSLVYHETLFEILLNDTVSTPDMSNILITGRYRLRYDESNYHCLLFDTINGYSVTDQMLIGEFITLTIDKCIPGQEYICNQYDHINGPIIRDGGQVNNKHGAFDAMLFISGPAAVAIPPELFILDRRKFRKPTHNEQKNHEQLHYRDNNNNEINHHQQFCSPFPVTPHGLVTSYKKNT